MTMEPVYVPRSPQEKAEQRALLQYYRPENRRLVLAALRRAGRQDLIGTGPNCLVPPEPSAGGRGGRNAPAGRRPEKKPGHPAGAGRYSRYSRGKKKK